MYGKMKDINLIEATEIIAVVNPGREVAGEQYFR